MPKQTRRIILWLCLLLWAAGCRANPTPPKPSMPTVTAAPAASPLASVPPATAAPAPSTLAVVNLRAEPADTVIRLSWQPVPGARGYFVFRDNSSTPLNPTPLAEARFEDIGLTNGRTYTYTVAAVNPDGQVGTPSAPIQAVPKSR